MPANGPDAHATPDTPLLSLVIPARDEADNIAPLIVEVGQALGGGAVAAGGFELIMVDDGSRDGTGASLRVLAEATPWLRAIALDEPSGQSIALHRGIAAAQGEWVATLDADLQNDPADLPGMLRRAIDEQLDLVQGDRSAKRRDNVIRRVGSRVGRLVRRLLLNDRVRDTGCSTRVMRATLAKQLPLDRPGMHRFIPALLAMRGARIAEVPVNHRPRNAGQTKYGLGILKRALPGLRDTLAVRRMARQPRLERSGNLPKRLKQEGGQV
ncbi:MAG: glycosyltransferase family 2 protein [Planctomycetota bacterium]